MIVIGPTSLPPLPKVGQIVRVDLDDTETVSGRFGVGYHAVVTGHLTEGHGFSIDVTDEALEDVPVLWTGTAWKADL